jgi:hypothetical protein
LVTPGVHKLKIHTQGSNGGRCRTASALDISHKAGRMGFGLSLPVPRRRARLEGGLWGGRLHQLVGQLPQEPVIAGKAFQHRGVCREQQELPECTRCIRVAVAGGLLNLAVKHRGPIAANSELLDAPVRVNAGFIVVPHAHRRQAKCLTPEQANPRGLLGAKVRAKPHVEGVAGPIAAVHKVGHRARVLLVPG